MLRIAVLAACAGAAASAQTGGHQFVRPPAGQTPPYNLAVKAGGVVYVSGTLPTDEKGNLVGSDVTAQAKQVFANLRKTLQQAGTSLDNAATVTVMLQNASDFAALDAVYKTEFKGEPPARTTWFGDMVRPGALVEIAVTALPNGAQRKVILPQGWAKPTSPYNYAIQSGDMLFLSGLVSRDSKTNKMVEGDIATQVKTCMDNAAEILKAAGMSMSDLVTTRIGMRDLAQFEDMNKAYRAYWQKDRPTRVTSQVGLPGTYGIEITLAAVKGQHQVIVPPTADGKPGSIGPNFSPAIKVGNRLFLSGESAATDANKTDMKAQTTATLANLERTLKAAGYSAKDVVSSEVWITDIKKFGDMNAGYSPVFPSDAPVRSTIGVGKLVGDNTLVEIAVTAVK
jgi:reactive intermediate/imine deaminase